MGSTAIRQEYPALTGYRGRVPPEFSALTDQISLTPDQYIGIPIALVGAVFLALGTQFQHRGVTKVEDSHGTGAKAGLNPRQLMALLSRPSWVAGTVLLGLAIVLQLLSLKFAPLIVVQPLGAVALVVTAIVNSRVSKVKLTRASIRAIVFCVGGVGLFVALASPFAKSTPITQTQLATVLILLAAVLVVFAVIFVTLRKRFKAVFYILGAGVLFGFVATLAKTVIDRVSTITMAGFEPDSFEWLTILCVVALLAASALGSYFVQSAHSHGPPDLVVAGLTVIDPLVAVTIGIVVLNEMAGAPLWTMFALLIAGGIAIYGVFLLSRVHVPSPEETNSVA
jgi:drug/metabolite transporter (DMT)-like permease